MKTHALIIQFLIWSVYSFGQGPSQPYLDPTSEWKYYAVGADGISVTETFRTMYLDGSLLINNTFYYRTFTKIKNVQTGWLGNSTDSSLTGPFYLREDSLGNFYYLDTANNTESLYLDNQAIVQSMIGDSFPIASENCTIQTIDYVYLGNQALKRVKGNNQGPRTGYLEGVGYIGLCCATGIEYEYYLNCYTRQGVTVQFGTQDCNSFPVPHRSNPWLKTPEAPVIRPEIAFDPKANTLTFLNASVVQMNAFSVYNNLGQLVVNSTFSGESAETIYIPELPNGIYIVSVTLPDGIYPLRFAKF